MSIFCSFPVVYYLSSLSYVPFEFKLCILQFISLLHIFIYYLDENLLSCLHDLSNGKLLFLTDLVSGLKRNKFSVVESNDISSFLERGFVRLEAWFQWFNTTQSGNLCVCVFFFRVFLFVFQFFLSIHVIVVSNFLLMRRWWK